MLKYKAVYKILYITYERNYIINQLHWKYIEYCKRREMRNTDTKFRFFKAVYKICKEQSIDFNDFNPIYPTLEQKQVVETFIKRNRNRDFSEFLNFYKKKIEEEKPLVILDVNQSTDNLPMEKVAVKKQKIYGGFIYIDRQKSLLLDRSYKGMMSKIGKKYLESERQKERNITNDNN